MKAYQFPKATRIEDLALVECETPQPGESEVLVRVRATSLNYRDLMIGSGKYRVAPRANLVPLSDGAGDVAAVGGGVTRFKVGDRVAGIFHQGWIDGTPLDSEMGTALGGDLDGMLAEYVVLNESGLVRIPDYLSFEEAATLPCAAVTAWYALFEGSTVRPGDTVLTLGTGGVSVFAMQFASAAGARVIATSSSDEKLEQALGYGATDLINYRTTPDWEKETLRLTAGRGVDHVIELGGAGTLPRSLQAVRRAGRVNVIGVLTGGGQIDPMAVLARHIEMRGVYVGSRTTFETMNRALETHKIRPVIDRVFDFSDAKAAYQRMESAGHVGKIVVRVS